jgi:NDP-sugar pyrophosphorylase family protein
MPRAIMLSGGQGSRLLPYRTIVPKPLLPVGNRSVLDIVLGQLAEHGFSDVTLAVGDLAALVRAMFGDGTRHGVSLTYAQEHEPLGTAGVLGELRPDEPFLMMNGNVLTTLDYRALFEAHLASGNAVTVATFERQVHADFGVLHLEDDGEGSARVVDYVEKPGTTYTVSMGIYAMQPVVCDYIEPGERLGLPDLILRLVAAGHRIGAHAHRGLWLDMRRREDYERAVTGHEDLVPLIETGLRDRTAA